MQADTLMRDLMAKDEYKVSCIEIDKIKKPETVKNTIAIAQEQVQTQINLPDTMARGWNPEDLLGSQEPEPTVQDNWMEHKKMHKYR